MAHLRPIFFSQVFIGENDQAANKDDFSMVQYEPADFMLGPSSSSRDTLKESGSDGRQGYNDQFRT